MLKQDISRRTDKTEIMDDFDLKGPELRKTLSDLDNINSWLGGNQITLDGIKELLKGHSKNKKIKIVDIGCGNGSILRKVAAWGKSQKREFILIGIDANEHAIQIAKEKSKKFENLSFEKLNIFSDSFKSNQYDIILCTLTLHHFKDKEIISLLNQLYTQAKLGIVINDLHRSNSAYILFQAFCSVFVNNEIARKDGLTSILRGFKRSDLLRYQEDISCSSFKISWKWAFRYQWIIKKEQ
ncbi:methyltransferase domain-containing protein [Gramella lutea]|uniref:Methyltransferase domain-containing protein n=1 Tax=Christiangramia lutea TaxID=1607951 RepID=A0A9X1V2K6_9FLAO|nr:methyltransferase domain-containing protein [Christiangramia lutea]MCH4823125.1 methyltransferase domain-containing protein [Christiangramia lutea]